MFVVLYKSIQKQWRDIGMVSLLYLLILFWFVLLNAYTLVPFILGTFRNMQTLASDVGGVQGQIAWAEYISENTSIINLLRLQGIPDWYNNGTGHPYASIYLSNPIFIATSFIFPVFILSLFTQISKKKKGAIAFFTFLFIISLFFSVGIHNPFGKLYEVFMRWIPGFFIFRSTIYKFGYAYWLAASVLIGMSISYLIEFFISKFRTSIVRNSVAFGMVIFIIFGLLGYHFPFLTGDMFHVTSGLPRMNVQVPVYVDEFAKWWRKESKNNKILLLPKLNESWLFEQYTWKYESLYPLLGNYGSYGLIENLEIMQPQERLFTNILYEAIESREYEKMYRVSAMLGARYFLVRGDFAYTIENQQTTDPKDIRGSLESNPDIQQIITFGPWIVYGYREDIPLVSGIEQEDILSGDLPLLLQSEQILSGRDILTSKNDLDGIQNNIESTYIVPQCISCAAEIMNFPVIFPETRILSDSPLYQFIQQRNTNSAKKLSGEPYVFALVGKTLKLVSELEASILKQKTYLIPPLAEEYIRTLKEIEIKTEEILKNNTNPYNFVFSLKRYLQGESDYIYYNVFSPLKEVLFAIQNASFAVDSLIGKLNNLFDIREYATKKIYSFTIPIEGLYRVYVQDEINGLSIVTSPDMRDFLIDNIPVTDSSSVSLDQGSHILEMHTKESSDIFTKIMPETIAGSSCFSSFSSSYSPEKAYRLEFMGKNAFSDRFYYFIDGGGTFAPTVSASLATIGNRLTKNDVLIEKGLISVKGLQGTIRVSFCAPELNEETYKESIQDLKLTEVLVPRIVLKSIETHIPTSSSLSVRFVKKNPVTYTVDIESASTPFFLMFREAFSNNWKATVVGSQSETDKIRRVENGYNNIWFVSKLGTYTVQLTYKPQKYFTFGALISGLCCVGLLYILYSLWKTKRL